MENKKVHIPVIYKKIKGRYYTKDHFRFAPLKYRKKLITSAVTNMWACPYYYIGLETYYHFSDIPINVMKDLNERIQMTITALRIMMFEKDIIEKKNFCGKENKKFIRKKTIGGGIKGLAHYNVNYLIRAPPYICLK